MASYLDSLLDGIADDRLRSELIREIRSLRNRKDFGLVFERHLPETVRLYGHDVKAGTSVQERAEVDGPLWRVRRITGREATVERREGAEIVTEVLSVDDLVTVRKFGDPIYPGLTGLGRIERGGERPWHVVVEAENFHALETLLYTHAGKVDAIYIDPPYNSGARDWKYNNDYVDAEDAYRHSKWLAFMERRLLLAKSLLAPDSSVLIVTVDEKEYLRLGLLLEQVFPNASIQMVTTVVSAKGAVRPGQFSRVEEHLYFVTVGNAPLCPWYRNMLDPAPTDSGNAKGVEWLGLRRREPTSVRGSRPNQFYPIFVNEHDGTLFEVGQAIADEVDRQSVTTPDGTVALWPLKPDGTEMIWGLTPGVLRRNWSRGFARVNRWKSSERTGTVQYLPGGTIDLIESGQIVVTGRAKDGSVIASVPGDEESPPPKRVWNLPSHNAETGGTKILSALIPGRRFPYPKSLYAVEDALRFVVGGNPEALVLDFFAGSGTTAHAVMRLNKQDGGARRCISVTNNEVSEAEASALASRGHRPGDPEWEALGIFEHVTRPRLTAAVTGLTPEGVPISGDYKFTDEFPVAEGFEENVEFFRLDYLGRDDVSLGRSFEAVAPLLWLKAGGVGPRIEQITQPWALPQDAVYGVLFDPQHWASFVQVVAERGDAVCHAFVVTDSTSVFQQVIAELPPWVASTMLYEDYISTFAINTGRGS